MIVFLVRNPVSLVIQNAIVTAKDREMAKSVASGALKGNPDEYEVTPITSPEERVIFITALEAYR